MIKGADSHIKRMVRLTSPAMVAEAGKAVYAAANMHAVDAALSITKGAVSGRGHVASKPGEPPNADTHLLDRSIEAAKTGPLKAESSANAPYAVKLEKGSSKVSARPFMEPAAKRVRPMMTKLLQQAVDRVAKGGTL